MTIAVAYTRTSSQTNVDGDSKDRQMLAIMNYADANDLRVIAQASDDAVRGADPIKDRVGLARLIDKCLETGCRIILVESPDRFSRDTITQELGYHELKESEIEVIPVDSPGYFTLNPTPTQTFIRQVRGAMAQFDKDTPVLKLRGARERRRELTRDKGILPLDGKGNCEGRKSVQERHPEVIELIPRMRGMHTRGDSFATIARFLFAKGIGTERGGPLTSTQVRRLCLKTQKTHSRTTTKNL